MFKLPAFAAILVLSIGFGSAFADDSLVNPDRLAFEHIPSAFIPQYQPIILDPNTGDEPVIDETKQYSLYEMNMGSSIISDDKKTCKH